jgi:hypothetical protein
MQKAIEKDQENIKKRYKNSPRHTLQVDFHPYKALIEKEIKATAVN